MWRQLLKGHDGHDVLEVDGSMVVPKPPISKLITFAVTAYLKLPV